MAQTKEERKAARAKRKALRELVRNEKKDEPKPAEPKVVVNLLPKKHSKQYEQVRELANQIKAKRELNQKESGE